MEEHRERVLNELKKAIINPPRTNHLRAAVRRANMNIAMEKRRDEEVRRQRQRASARPSSEEHQP